MSCAPASPDPEWPSPSRSRNPRILRRTAGALALAAVAALAALGVWWKPLRNQILLSVTARPAPYTELYLSDYAALPPVVHPGATYPVRFTIVSHQPGARQFPVTETVAEGTRVLSVRHQLFRLDQGGRVTATVLFSPPSASAPYRVAVSLADGQSVQWRTAAP